MADVVITPELPTQDNCDVLSRMPAYMVDQGVEASLEWTIRDRNGLPINLVVDGSDETLRVEYRAKEALGCSRDGVAYYKEDGEITDPTQGVVQAPLETSLAQLPGIYRVQWGVFRADKLLYTNSGLMSVEPNLFGDPVSPRIRPLTLQEVRLYIRDNSPTENYKLRRQEFSDAEVLQALLWPIEDFNEAPPPLTRRFTTCDFPWRQNQLRATMARLFELGATWMRRNKFAYQAGGLTVQEEAAAEDYQREADKLLAEWRIFRDATKLRLNASDVWGIIDSPYAYRW
jgi:hypothetical protein